MNSITPNRELIRRICLINKGSECYISIDNDKQIIIIYVDIPANKHTQLIHELHEWSGMNYQVEYTKDNELELIGKEKILPIY